MVVTTTTTSTICWGFTSSLPMSLAHAKAKNILGQKLLHENHFRIIIRLAKFHEPTLQSWLVNIALMLLCANFHVIYVRRLRNVVLFFCGKEMDLHQFLQVKDFLDHHNRDRQWLVFEHDMVKPLIHVTL